MPLLRDLTMRLFDNYVGTNLTSLVRNEYQSQFDLGFHGNTFPATNVNVYVPSGFVYNLPDQNVIIGLDGSTGNTLSTDTGHIYDFITSHATQCVLFDSSFSLNGFLFDEDNDDLLMPSEDGEFTISMWVNPYIAPSGHYDILSKKITATTENRFLVRYDSTGVYPVIKFSTADATGASSLVVEARIIPGRWSLVVLRCTKSLASISIRGADGFVSSRSEGSLLELGCRLAGDNLYCGIGPDGTSNPLHNGSFLLQQVCFWKKKITAHEETELFSLGRGKTRFSDSAVPETFNGSGKYGSIERQHDLWDVDIDSNGIVTHVYENIARSPYAPCKTCDSEPVCFPHAMVDPSPDQINLSVAWTATPDGCVPSETEFTMNRLGNQIIQGFIFGRTYESEKIQLPCGGYIRFFLESTPLHWSEYKYRQYLGVETSFGGYKIAKYNITMGSALVRNAVVGGANKFTSPSPTLVDFDFPYSDSYQDYANDIVSSGWTSQAEVVLEEGFTPDNCASNEVDAACIVADGYRFGFGPDFPESRGGYYGWQQGISEVFSGSTILALQDSIYNYRIGCGSPAVSSGNKVVPFSANLNRPFSALAKGLIGLHGSDGKFADGSLPFSGFSAVLTPAEFVRPQPFHSTALRNGCVDCEVSSAFDGINSAPGLNPIREYTTKKITSSDCPQKTLSGATSSVLSGSMQGYPPGSGLTAVIGAPASAYNALSSSARFTDTDVNLGGAYPIHLGGTMRPTGHIQFTSQIDDFNQGEEGAAFLLVDTKSDGKIDPNTPSDNVPIIKNGTKIDPYIEYTVANPPPTGRSFGPFTPISSSEIRTLKLDQKTVSSPLPIEIVPIPGTQELTISNCNTCYDSCITSMFSADVDGIQYASDIGIWGPSGAFPAQSSVVFDGTQTIINCDGRQIAETAAAVSNEFSDSPGVSATITGIKIVEECPDLVAKIQYTVTHRISVSRITRNDTRGPDNGITHGSGGGGYDEYLGSHTEGCEFTIFDEPYSPDDVIVLVRQVVNICGFADDPFQYGFTENREAVFRIENTDTCLRPNRDRDRSVVLAFIEDRLVGDRVPLVGSLVPGTSDLDVASLQAAYDGVASFGENPNISALGDCLCQDPPYDQPVLNSVIATPATYEFLSAVVTLAMSTPDISEQGFPEEYTYNLPSRLGVAYSGDHSVLSEIGEMNWIENSDDVPHMKSILRSNSWTLEIMQVDDDHSLCRRIAARYRIAGFPHSRWNKDGDNQMQLVSADWSIGRWPAYLTVSPA